MTKCRTKIGALSDADGNIICETFLGFADLVKPCTRHNVAEIFEKFIATLPTDLQKSMPFTALHPGREFIRAFMQSH